MMFEDPLDDGYDPVLLLQLQSAIFSGESHSRTQFDLAARLLHFSEPDHIPSHPELTNLRELFLFNYCDCFTHLSSPPDAHEDYLRYSGEFLRILSGKVGSDDSIGMMCSMRVNRAMLCSQKNRHQEVILECDEFLKISPLVHKVAYMRCLRIMALIRLWEMVCCCDDNRGLHFLQESFEDFRQLEELLEMGYGKGFEMLIEIVSANVDALKGVDEGKTVKTRIAERYARRLLRIGGSPGTPTTPNPENYWGISIQYDEKQDDEGNVSYLIAQFQRSTIDLSGLLVDENLSINLPSICCLRKVVDALVHMSFLFESGRIVRYLSKTEPANVTILRFSDSLKSPLLLRSWPTELDWTSRFSDLCLVASAQDLLDEIEGLVIAYHLILDCQLCEDCVVRWVIKEGEIIHRDRRVFAEQRLSWKKIQEGLLRFVELPTSCQYSEVVDSAEEQRRICGEMHSVLLGGLERFLEGEVDHVTFVPDRELFRVPFMCLYDGNSSQYLVERCSVSVSSSLRLIRLNREQKESVLLCDVDRSTSLICGQSGPIFQQEMRQFVTETAKSKGDDTCEVLFGAEFTPLVLSQCFDRPDTRVRFLHVTSHGYGGPRGDDDDPFAWSEFGDVFEQFRLSGHFLCHGSEIFPARDVPGRLKLERTDLTFLNCCSLAGGKDREIGILGFNRAIFQAGCPSIVSALWPVFARVSMWIARSFYKHLLSDVGGEMIDKAQALRLAVLEVFEQHKVRDVPVVWASFQLFGNRF